MSNREIRKFESKKTKKKKKRLRLFIYLLLLLLLTGGVSLILYTLKNPIIVNPLKTKISIENTYDPYEAISFVLFGNKEDVKAETNVDTSKIGKYKTTYTFKDHKIDIPVQVVDNVSPVLVLQEYTTDEVEKVKPESFIKEIQDTSEVKTKIKKEHKIKKGEYEVTIEAEDEYGNKTTGIATLYRKKDTTAPTFTTELSEVIFYENEPFDYLENVQVTDDLDTNPKIETNADEIVAGPGDYTLTYTAKDRSGNTTQAIRIVHIEEIPEENQRIVYLTFDDGPSNNTERVLDILAQYQVKATFFVTGNGQSRNDLIQRAHNEGHTIGLHTYSHDYAIYQSEETYFNDLNAVSNMVYDLIGIHPNVIRFPGGASNTVSANYCQGIMSRLVNAVGERGFYYFDWNVSSSDASGDNVDTEQIVASSTSGSAYDHVVLLMHDTDAKGTTVEALPRIIEYYRDQGYIFKGLSYRSPECHHGVNN
ncbi:MAG: polysaccharide deacetylase family protein [Bacillota bacterium]|nr:polysaccharide deacetylase family protein [Bacillota bacterium]